MTLSDIFRINGIPLLAPDQDVAMYWEDLDAPESGRDESGYMHRIVLRRKLRSWDFTYSCLTQQEYGYMQSLLGNLQTFTFTFPNPADPQKTLSTQAYLSQYGVVWRNAQTGLYKNLKFRIIEC